MITVNNKFDVGEELYTPIWTDIKHKNQSLIPLKVRIKHIQVQVWKDITIIKYKCVTTNPKEEVSLTPISEKNLFRTLEECEKAIESY